MRDAAWVSVAGWLRLRCSGAVGKINRPAAFAGPGLEVRIRIHGERMGGDGEHVSIPAGVAEGGVDLFLYHFAQSFWFSSAGGNPHEAIGDDAVVEFDLRGQNAVVRNAE